MSFLNKVVLVTGAGAGIGAATAISFATEGARVAIVDLNEDGLTRVAEKCAERGSPALTIKADLTNDEAAKTAVSKTVEQFGKLNILVNNAGISKSGSLLNGDILEAYDAIFSINVRAVIHLTAVAAPHLIKTKGNIINVSSVGGLFTPKSPRQAMYNVSKAALDHFTRCSALELASSGIRVNSVNPGPVKTNLLSYMDEENVDKAWEKLKSITAFNRLGESEEIADLILFLASDKARSITGSIFVSDNGFLLKA